MRFRGPTFSHHGQPNLWCSRRCDVLRGRHSPRSRAGRRRDCAAPESFGFRGAGEKADRAAALRCGQPRRARRAREAGARALADRRGARHASAASRRRAAQGGCDDAVPGDSRAVGRPVGGTRGGPGSSGANEAAPTPGTTKGDRYRLAGTLERRPATGRHRGRAATAFTAGAADRVEPPATRAAQSLVDFATARNPGLFFRPAGA